MKFLYLVMSSEIASPKYSNNYVGSKYQFVYNTDLHLEQWLESILLLNINCHTSGGNYGCKKRYVLST